VKKILIVPKDSKKYHFKNFEFTADLFNFLFERNVLCTVLPYPLLDKEVEFSAEFWDLTLQGVCGIILLGGKNIKPDFDSDRDRFESQILGQCENRKIGVLGICRGMQMLNVFYGGTIQNIPQHKTDLHQGFRPNQPKIQHWENIDFDHGHTIVLQNSLLKALNKSKIRVNSIHQMQVDQLARGFEIAAQSECGIIEAFSNEKKKILGVQFHPELDLQNSDMQKVIELWLKWIW
jgi:gamma-glutamyl-gamma-aminobutyrate hydrolase PuuD